MITLFKDPFFGEFDWYFNHYPCKCETTSKIKVDKDDEGYKVLMSVPGLTKEDIDLNIKDGVITISHEKEEKTDDQYFMSSFTKSYNLPDDVNVDKISGKVENGVLEIVLPFDKKKIKSRQIEIQ